jgi:hypothetical protein
MSCGTVHRNGCQIVANHAQGDHYITSQEARSEILVLSSESTIRTERSEITVNGKFKEATTTEAIPTLTTEATSELQEQIRHRAYELYEQRGGEDGRELDDWLQAEAEVAQSMAKAKAA